MEKGGTKGESDEIPKREESQHMRLESKNDQGFVGLYIGPSFHLVSTYDKIV